MGALFQHLQMEWMSGLASSEDDGDDDDGFISPNQPNCLWQWRLTQWSVSLPLLLFGCAFSWQLTVVVIIVASLDCRRPLRFVVWIKMIELVNESNTKLGQQQSAAMRESTKRLFMESG